MGQARRIVAGIAVILLFLPASASVPTAQWNIHLIQRLRGLKRISPDADLDLAFRKFLPFLPEQGSVGFQSVDPADEGRLFFRAQYALVPRQMLRSTRTEFVIEAGPANAAGSLSRDPRFRIVTSPDDDIRLFRRVQ